MSRYKDWAGCRFGRLTAISFEGHNKRNRALWKCLCDCGKYTIVMIRHLQTGAIVSCGCFRLERVIKAHTKHGLSHTKIYKAAIAKKRRDMSSKLDSKWTVEMEYLIKEIFPFCILCGSCDKLEIDHLNPLSKGYGLVPGNAVVLCRTCNRRKANKNLEDLPALAVNKLLLAANHFHFECFRAGIV